MLAHDRATLERASMTIDITDGASRAHVRPHRRAARGVSFVGHRAAAAVAVALLLAGCGSTVEAGGAHDAGLSAPGTNIGPGATNSGSYTGSPAGTTALAGGGVAGGPGSTGFGTSSSANVGSGTSATEPSVGTDGPGLTKTTISIGITYYQSAKAANAALGARGVDTGDPVAASRVLVAAINGSGGIAGRRVVPLFYAIDPQSAQPYASEAQAECSYFSEDHHVFAVLDGTPAADARACLAKHGVAVLRDVPGLVVAVPSRPEDGACCSPR